MRERDLKPELMDDPAIDPAALEAAWRGLARLNAVSGAFGALWAPIAREARNTTGPLHVLDIGCARGDFVIRAARRARREGLDIRFSGCDLNTKAIEMAREQAASAGLSCDFFPCDVLRDPPRREHDVVTSSLLLHHLDRAQAIAALTNMREHAKRFVLVNDLVRSGLNSALIWLGSRGLTMNRVVRADAMISARAAFTHSELLQCASAAGLSGATTSPGGLARTNLFWRRP